MNLPTPPGSEPSGAPRVPGQVLLGRFRVDRILGRGGMGEVLLARDVLLNRAVAIKQLRAGDDDPGDRRRAVLREARRISQIHDPRIATLHDVLELDGDVLLVMEYVEGMTLRQRMALPLALDDFWELAGPCLSAVGAAHAHGIIHRDIKPENLMVTPDGGVKVLDFGIARRSSPSSPNTTTLTDPRDHFIAGTPSYMAPEAHVGADVDERSDLFSLGVVFYEMLAGRRPFEGPSIGAVLQQMLTATPTPTQELHPGVGPALSDLIARLLSREPVERPATAADVARLLAEARARDERVPRSAGDPSRPPVTAAAASDPRGADVEPATARAGLPVAGGFPTPLPGAAPRPARPWWLRGRAVAVAVGLVAVAVIAVWRAPPPFPAQRSLALLAPATPGADAEFTHWARGAGALLSERLRRHIDTPGFQLASFGESVDEGLATAPDARRVHGATLALGSTWEQNSSAIRARLELRDTESDRVLGATTVEGPATDPFGLHDRVYRAVLELVRLRDDGVDTRRTVGIRGTGTLRFYLQGRGRILLQETEADARGAVADLEMACRTEPQAAAPRAALASAELAVHLRTHDPEWLARSERSARQAAAMDSSRPDGHRALARALEIRKAYDEACVALSRVMRLDPTDNVAALHLGRDYGRMGQSERERATYEAVARRRPHDWEPWWWLATFHFRRGNVADAVHAYEAMVERAPQFHKGYSSLGGLLVLRGDYPRAIEVLKHSVALRPTRTAFDNLGTAYFNSGRLDDAVAAYNQSFQFGDPDYQSWINLGDAYFWLRDRKTDATQAYEQSVHAARDEVLARARRGSSVDPMIPANLATVFPKLGHADSARAQLRLALAADSANPMVQYCAALTLWQLNERSAALDWMRRAVAGGYPTVWLRDSPIFREWKQIAEFKTLIEAAEPPPSPTTSGNTGG